MQNVRPLRKALGFSAQIGNYAELVAGGQRKNGRRREYLHPLDG
jgi:hypothetical protein